MSAWRPGDGSRPASSPTDLREPARGRCGPAPRLSPRRRGAVMSADRAAKAVSARKNPDTAPPSTATVIVLRLVLRLRVLVRTAPSAWVAAARRRLRAAVAPLRRIAAAAGGPAIRCRSAVVLGLPATGTAGRTWRGEGQAVGEREGLDRLRRALRALEDRAVVARRQEGLPTSRREAAREVRSLHPGGRTPTPRRHRRRRGPRS